MDSEWETPAWLFKRLDREFRFTVDVCAMPWSAKVERYISPTEDGLEQPWAGVCWMNPPYGVGLADWVAKAWAAAQCGATVVCLLPARTEASWFHDYVLAGADEIRFVRRRLRFSGAGRAPFASMVVIFRAGERGPQPGAPRVGAIDQDDDQVLDVEAIAVEAVGGA